MTAKALLLAGGLGTRLRPLTNTVPKCLVPIAGKPMLDYWYDSLEAANVKHVLLNTHHLREQVCDHIEKTNKNRDLKVTEAWEPELLGSAGTVHANRNFADDADVVVIIYADNLSTIDIREILDAHDRHEHPMTMALFHTPYPKQCGIASLSASGLITKFVEKPENPESDLANAGLYVVDADAWRGIADMDVFDFGFDVLPKFVGRMHGFEINGYHRDIGNPEALAQAQADARKWFA